MEKQIIKSRFILGGLIMFIGGFISTGILCCIYKYFTVITQGVSFMGEIPHWKETVIQVMFFIIFSVIIGCVGIILIFLGLIRDK